MPQRLRHPQTRFPGDFQNKHDQQHFCKQGQRRSLFGGFDLPQSAFLPPVPEIQVARVENAQPVGLHQKGHAQIGGLIGLDPDVLRQLLLLQGSQPFADGADGHIAGNDVGNGQPFLGPRVYHGIQMVGVSVADEDVDAFVGLQQLRPDAD